MLCWCVDILSILYRLSRCMPLGRAFRQLSELGLALEVLPGLPLCM